MYHYLKISYIHHVNKTVPNSGKYYTSVSFQVAYSVFTMQQKSEKSWHLTLLWPWQKYWKCMCCHGNKQKRRESYRKKSKQVCIATSHRCMVMKEVKRKNLKQSFRKTSLSLPRWIYQPCRNCFREGYLYTVTQIDSNLLHCGLHYNAMQYKSAPRLL